MRLFSILLIFGAQFLSAQVVGGLRGIVVDRSGAVLPGTKIQVRNTSADTTSETTSLADGTFCLDGLAIGAYELTITPPAGFRPYESKGLLVNAGEVRDLGRLTLALGQLTSEIRVTAVPAPLSVEPAHTTSQLDLVFDRTPVWSFPLCDLFPDTVIFRDGQGWHVKFPGAEQPEPVVRQPSLPRKQL